MKRLFVIILVFLLFTACGSSSDTGETGSEPSPDSLFEFTVPKGYIDGPLTQNRLDEEAEENGYEYAFLNPDGSVKYCMTVLKHRELMDSLREETEATLRTMIKDIPTFLSIDHDEKFTSFTVEVGSDELSLRESASMIKLFALGRRYNVYSGEQDAVVRIDYVHNGETVFSCDSSQLK